MPGPRGLVQQLDQKLHRAVFPRNVSLLVAVSGGADSVALLRLLHAVNRSTYWRWKLVVGHVDHGIRGAAARADARFVANLARALKLPFVARRLKLARNASEEEARRGRLAALAAMCRQKKCAAVIMAHHADDQAETVVLRIFRGTGIEGLAAMAPQITFDDGLTILRPLLEFRRAALRSYLQEIGQTWREDQTNLSDVYLRNRVRHQLMPLVESLWPRGADSLVRLAALARQAHAAIAAAATRFLEQTPGWGEGSVIQFPRSAFRELPEAVAAEVLRHLIDALVQTGAPEIADYDRLQAALAMLRGTHGSKQIQLGGDIVVTARSGLIRLERTGAVRRAARGVKR